MAKLGENLRTAVLAIPEVAAIVGDRMGQNKVEQGDPLPYLFYQRLSESSSLDLDMTAGLKDSTWTIEAVSRDLDEAIELVDLIKEDGTGALHGFIGMLGDQFVSLVDVSDKDDDYVYVNPTDEGLNVAAITVDIIS